MAAMGIFTWLGDQWFVLLQSVGIIASLLLTTLSLRDDLKTRRVSNLITMTQHHHKLWSMLFTQPELMRILNPSVDLHRTTVTKEEELFVGMVILLLNCSFQAMKMDSLVKPEGLNQDVHSFFSLPIPKAVWGMTKRFQDQEFVRFVEMN